METDRISEGHSRKKRSSYKIYLDKIVNLVYIVHMKNWTPKEIRDFRKRLNMTQAAFSVMIGVTRVYVNYLERGVKNPSRTMKLLLECLKKQMRKERKVMKHGKDKKKG